MEIKDIIRVQRKKLGLTMLDVAKACDVSEGTVSRWESGNIDNMKRSRIAALANILNISPSIIVGSTAPDLELESFEVEPFDERKCQQGVDFKSFSNNEILDDEIIVINRAAKNMSDEEKKKMIELLKVAFSDKFED